MRFMKGQMTPISLVLVTGIVITLVGAAFLWSGPLFSKNEARTTAQTAIAFALSLDKDIVEAANAGAGHIDEDLPFGAITVYPYGFSDPDLANSIVFQFPINSQLALSTGVTYLGGVTYEDTQSDIKDGVLHASEPAIKTLEVVPKDTEYIGVIKIQYRDLVSESGERFTIALNKNFQDPLSGTSKITATHSGSEPLPDGVTTLTLVGVSVS